MGLFTKITKFAYGFNAYPMETANAGKSFTLFTAETQPAVAGDGLSALLLGKQLVQTGNHVALVCLNPNGLLKSYDQIEGVAVVRIPYGYKSMWGRFLFRLRLIKYLICRADKKSIWMVYGAMPGFRVVLLLAHLYRVKLIFRSTLWDFDDANTLAGKLYQIPTRILLQKTHIYWALNSAFSAAWQKVVKRQNVFQSFQGVDLEYQKIKLNDGDVDRLKEKYSIPKGKTLILMVGHLISRKGYPEIFDWLSMLDDDFLLLHAGTTNAPEWDTMNRFNDEMARNVAYAQKTLGTKVHFLGRQSQMREIYQLADILLVASHAEGYPPNSVNEAMAAGKPVITRRIPGVSDAITDGLNGYVFSDFDEFRTKLSRLINNPLRRDELGRNARIFAQDKLDIRKIVSRFFSFIENQI